MMSENKELILALDVSTTSTGWALFKGKSLVVSGVIKPQKKKDYFERGYEMAVRLRSIESEYTTYFDKQLSAVVVEKNSVMGSNQHTMMSIGIVTGMILQALSANNVSFVNVSIWRKFWRFDYKDRSKKSMKRQSVLNVDLNYGRTVGDDEADAILIGGFYANCDEKQRAKAETHKKEL